MRFVIIAFVFMGWSFYELSGGDEFDPVETRLSRIEAPAEGQIRVASSVPKSTDTPALNLQANPASPERKSLKPPAPQVTLARAEVEPVETQPIVLPSLVQNAPIVSQVSFSDDGQAASDLDVASADLTKDTRIVTGNSVNVRGGPGTAFSVVNKLGRGDEVEVLQNPGNGWVKLRPVSGGPEGWMADFLLSES